MEATAQTDEKYMRLALNEAREAFNQGEVPIGAVIVSGGAIVGRGHNLVETLTDVTAHAEIQALTAASATLGGKYLPDCTLYVTVEPCVMCAGALAWSQIGRIVYGASDPKRGYTRIGRALLHPDARISADAQCNKSPHSAAGTPTSASFRPAPGANPDGTATPPIAWGTSEDRVATHNGMVANPTARGTSDGTATPTTAWGASDEAVATHNGMVANPTARGTSDGTATPPTARGASDEAVAKLLLHPKTRVTAGVLAAECEALMSEFFVKLRR